jgi:hypothetical protein
VPKVITLIEARNIINMQRSNIVWCSATDETYATKSSGVKILRELRDALGYSYTLNFPVPALMTPKKVVKMLNKAIGLLSKVAGASKMEHNKIFKATSELSKLRYNLKEIA